jgi:hypothetical protein
MALLLLACVCVCLRVCVCVCVLVRCTILQGRQARGGKNVFALNKLHGTASSAAGETHDTQDMHIIEASTPIYITFNTPVHKYTNPRLLAFGRRRHAGRG